MTDVVSIQSYPYMQVFETQASELAIDTPYNGFSCYFSHKALLSSKFFSAIFAGALTSGLLRGRPTGYAVLSMFTGANGPGRIQVPAIRPQT